MDLRNLSRDIRYSLVENWSASTLNAGNGIANLNPADPLFVDEVFSSTAPTTDGDYRLRTGSPAWNSGNSNATTVPTDLDGNDRFIRSIDSGAGNPRTASPTPPPGIPKSKV